MSFVRVLAFVVAMVGIGAYFGAFSASPAVAQDLDSPAPAAPAAAPPAMSPPPLGTPATATDATNGAASGETSGETTGDGTTVLGDGSFVAEMIAHPLTLQAVWNWTLTKVPPLLTIVCLTMLVLFLARVLEERFIKLIARTGKRGSEEERENRARTLTSVFHNAVTVVTISFAAVAILDLFGIAVSAVLGGAAVVGLAVAFGSQALIKDYLTGFILLMEQQYLINDVITLNGVTGQVERITLRMTTLRDADGAVHFIPHGQVSIVTNQTHLWSRAVVDVPVGKDADVDATMNELVKIAQGLRSDPNFQKAILGDAMMLGVESVSSSGDSVVRFFVKTKPMQQWPVKRELLRRIKKHFAELQNARPTIRRTPGAAPASPVSGDA
ncbi:MAG TPA: mechanosensitive ion channel family protein, partial [Pirellulales bacterium]